MGWVRVAPFRSRLAHSKKLFGASQQTDTDSIPPVDFTNESSSENTDHINVDAPEEESLQALEEEIIDFSNTSMPVDPKQQAIMQKETVLRAQLLELEERLRRNRLELGRVKDRVSESGKNGFFLVQAQVNEFLVSRCYFAANMR
ncbi:hypothetical protein EON65_34680 [archaeon]|nr:MAG: hypothetical protein EON65_34680 [archaeon]